MKEFTLTVKFHAENALDAMEQADRAVDAFDDGFERMTLSSPGMTFEYRQGDEFRWNRWAVAYPEVPR